MATHSLTTGSMPVAILHEIHDMLTLALAASERATGYTQAEREARSYTRAALRRVSRYLEGTV